MVGLKCVETLEISWKARMACERRSVEDATLVDRFNESRDVNGPISMWRLVFLCGAKSGTKDLNYNFNMLGNAIKSTISHPVN